MKKKLKLDSLKVESFVTTINSNEQKNLNGGSVTVETIALKSIHIDCPVVSRYHGGAVVCSPSDPIHCAIAY